MTTAPQSIQPNIDGCLSAEDREALDQVFIAHLKKETASLKARAEQAERRVEDLEETIEMARSRCNAALMGDEPCKPCIEIAISYLDATLSKQEPGK